MSQHASTRPPVSSTHDGHQLQPMVRTVGLQLSSAARGGIVRSAIRTGTTVVGRVRRWLRRLWAVIDTHYQQFVQARIDPLLGRKRDEQQKALALEGIVAINDREKAANRHMAFGLGMFGAALAGTWLFPPLIPVVVVIGCLFTLSVYKEAYRAAVATRRPGLIHLVAVYITAIWLGGHYVVGAMAMAFYFMREKLLVVAEGRSRQGLINVFAQQPRAVWVLIDGVEMEIPFAQVRVGDSIVLNAGQTVPVDGVILQGTAVIDQHMLTGESQPVEKTPGDPVLATTVVLAGKMVVQVEKAGADTTAAQIGEMLNHTADYRASMVLETLERAEQSVVPLLAVSALSWPLIGSKSAMVMLGTNFTPGMMALGPITMLNCLNIASHRGILVKDGRALEWLNKVDTIVFDKTGTLTQEQPHVVHIHTCNGMTEDELLRLTAAAEHRQTHPIARAIQAAAVERHLPLLSSIDHAEYEVGYGIKVQLLQHLVHVGSQRFMTMEGLDVPVEFRELQAYCHEQGHSLVLVGVDNVIGGGIELQPTVRAEAKRIIEGLHARDISLSIISGDHKAPTRKLATELGISTYFANTLPTHKATLIAQLQEQGHCVCFIGDGINDAIAMRQADVSISLRGATTAATDTAQIVLMDASLNQLLTLLDLAHEFDSNLKTNFMTSAALSICTAAGVFILHFGFASTEILFSLNMLIGLGIAMKPLLDHKKDGQPGRADGT
jgi:heavy metal translocating P-type ATPase